MRKILSLSTLLLVATIAVFSQKTGKVVEGKQGMYPSFVSFGDESTPGFTKGKILFTDAQAKVTGSSLTTKLAGYEKDKTGAEHYRYQQVINGIAVEHAVYIVHSLDKKVIAENGIWIKDIPTSLPVATLSETSALKYALQFVNARSYKWQDAGEEAFIKRMQNNRDASFYPRGQLVLYSGEDEVIPSALRPAYKFDIYATDPVSRQIIFVDAVNGAILGKRELLHTTNASGTAVTGYSGTQHITTDKTGTAPYRLSETGRGKGIQTFNMQKSQNYGNAIDFTDADNTWNNVNASKDQYATDAHWSAEKTYDYYLTKFGRNSIDNAGFAIFSYVHYGVNFLNAFWDGFGMNYGDGNSSDGNLPLTSLDFCGHEISHGLTQFTSGLVYGNESGALNEGFSDIMGTAIEFYARPAKADWILGGDFFPSRSMSNPNIYGQPDTYKGINWYTGTADNGGVHTNSGVLNFWFYLLSVGGRGTNDFGTAYNVTGLGIDKAAAIAYRTNTVYLVSTSKYSDTRIASIKAATDLYGSAAATQVTNAWNAVGVGISLPPPLCTDNFESNETQATAKSLPLNTDNIARIGSATDKDWFKFTTTQTAPNLSVVLSNLPKDYDIKLYNSSGTQLAISQNGGTSYETITRNTTIAGTYYLQVYGYAGVNSTSCYTLSVTTSGFNLFTNDTEGLITGEKPNIDKLNTFGAYPNPVKNGLTLYVNAENSNRTQLSMMDITGRLVMKQPLQVQKGVNAIPVIIPRLPAGTYILKMEGLKAIKVQVIQ